METSFLKLHAGNTDIALIDTDKCPIDERLLPSLTRSLCDRRRGVGARGVVLIGTSVPGAHLFRYFNSAGLKTPLHFDALLCSCRYLFDLGLVRNDTIRFLTESGNIDVEAIDSLRFRIPLAEPRDLSATNILHEISDANYTVTLRLEDGDITATPIFLGGPAYVLFHAGSRDEMLRLREGIRRNLPRGDRSRLIFAQVFSQEEISMSPHCPALSYDIASCAGIAAVAAVVNGFSEREATVVQGQNAYFVQWLHDEVFVSGTAEYCFSGSFYLDEGREDAVHPENA